MFKPIGVVHSGTTHFKPEVIKKIDFRSLVNEELVDNYDMVLLMAVIENVKNRYANLLVGYFLGKSHPFPIVQNYVNNTWAKFGLQKLMKNEDGVFRFKFASKDGLDRVLERGPWIICNTPLILNRWTPNVSLKRDEVTKVPVWIKLHNVPVIAYSADGLSLIATQVRKSIMLDAFTSSMCEDSWGQINFACALVEINADSVLKHDVSMAFPMEDGTRYNREVIRVEYEWKPPHCTDYVREPVIAKTTIMNSDGFTEVKRKKNKGKKADQQPRSRHIDEGANDINKEKGPSTSNSFNALKNMDIRDDCGVSSSKGIQEEKPKVRIKTFQ
ncbi:reverse transcriptase domain-containing protein [Tanacetum coccineum]